MNAQIQAREALFSNGQAPTTTTLTREVKARRMAQLLESAADAEKLAHAAAKEHQGDELVAQLLKTVASLHAQLGSLGRK